MTDHSPNTHNDSANAPTENPVRCLHYVSDICFELGGAVRAAVDMMTQVASHGHRINLLTHDPQDCPDRWPNPHRDDLGLTIFPRGSAGGWRHTPASVALMRREVERADVVHLHTPWDPGNIKLAGIARTLGKPYIVTLHGMLDDWSMAQKSLKKKVYLKLVGRRLLENAAFVHCTAQSEMVQSTPWYPQGTPRITPYVIDLEPYRTLPPVSLAHAAFPVLNGPGTKLLFLSRIHVKKGVGRLIQATAQLVGEGKDVQVLIAGPGDEPYATQMRELVTRLGLEDRVHFLGMVRDELKLSLYRACDLFVLPTSQENFGLVLPESLLCETPLVTTFGVDIWAELQEAGGVIVKPQTDAIASAVREIMDNPAAQEGLGERGRAYVLDWLDPDQTAKKFVAMYRDAMAKATT